MANYAYISSDHLLRIAGDKDYAIERSINGRCVETDIEFQAGGYPIWEVVKDGEKVKDGIFVYSETQMKYDAQWFGIKPIKELGQLYKECLGATTV